MDFVLGIESGLISALIGLGMTFVGLEILKSRIKGMIVGLATEIWEDFGGMPRLNSELNGFAAQKLAELLQFVHDNPKSVQPVIQGLINDIGGAFPEMKALTGGSPELSDGIGAIMPLIPKKYRLFAYLGQAFIGKGGKDKQTPKSGGFR